MSSEIFGIGNEKQFDECCLRVFDFQYNYNPLYRRYVNLVGVERSSVKGVEQIPFLPISLFKTQKLISSADPAVEAEAVFTSSSTTGKTPSRHYVTDLGMYETSFLKGFELFYGKPSEYAILALLPSYLERGGSSLVYMAEHLIRLSNHPQSGFYLDDFDTLYRTMLSLREKGQKTLLLGVTFALLDFASKFEITPSDWSLIVMETGGMKGRREKLERGEVHTLLKGALGVKTIHSEYGMCELLSQAYSTGEGIFRTPPWMKTIMRDIINPFKINRERGAINIVDLANLYSCSFIQTDDIGRMFEDGSFIVEGRLSNAERRGCNMLIE